MIILQNFEVDLLSIIEFQEIKNYLIRKQNSQTQQCPEIKMTLFQILSSNEHQARDTPRMSRGAKIQLLVNCGEPPTTIRLGKRHSKLNFEDFPRPCKEAFKNAIFNLIKVYPQLNNDSRSFHTTTVYRSSHRQTHFRNWFNG